MPTTRQQVIDRLATCEATELRLVLDAALIAPAGAESARALAERVVNGLWWAWCTPLGYALDRVSLDDIVEGVARRLKVRDQVKGDEAWSRLSSLHAALATTQGALSFDALRPDHQARARRSMFPSMAMGSGGVGSIGVGVGGRLFLRFAATPIGRLLPWIPQVRPWFKAIHKASGVAAVVGTPLGVALGVLAVNQALSTEYRKVLPLLLSIGALAVHERTQDAIELMEPV